MEDIQFKEVMSSPFIKGVAVGGGGGRGVGGGLSFFHKKIGIGKIGVLF